jgi:signal transduction histidine kinase
VSRGSMSPRDADGEDLEEQLALFAHELLSPLTVAHGYAALLTDHLRTLDEAATDLAERAARNLDLALLLLQRLRDAATSDDGLALVRSRVDLTGLVERTVEDLGATVAIRHPVEVATPAEALVVEADETRIRQVLFNLVVNAARYSPEGEPIHVTLAVDGCVTLEVRNHGFGVAPDDAERLFQKGTRGEGAGTHGLGIGLHLSRRIAEAHHGSLRVEPAAVRGSRFILELPLPD